ncbi:hypothetical protein SRABI83_01899 [Arthrobacter sp. Bi83]|nr:hypothetical protein SRABI83_01899 [Arthrobacter sp. Bi83]
MKSAVDIEWAFRRFSAHGKSLPETILATLTECHNEHADGQALVRSRHKRSYGQVSYTVQERLEEALTGLEGVEFKRPGRGKPKVLVVNGTALLTWRYSRLATAGLKQQKYGTSDARVGNFSMPVGPSQGMLDLGDGVRASLTPEETDFVDALRELDDSESLKHHRVVVVAYASNHNALHNAIWADAQLDEDGTLILQNAQVLFDADSADAAAMAELKGFDSQPRRALNLMPKEASGS